MSCEYPRTEISRLKVHASRDHNIYQMWWETGKHDLLKAVGVKVVNNPGWWLSEVDIACCAQLDFLYTIYMGIVSYRLTWLQRVLALYGWLQQFDDIWRLIPAYDLITKQSKSYSEISYFTGKE